MPATVTQSPQRAILIELLQSMCHKPDLLHVEFNEGPETVRVRVIAHPNDSRIIVGGNRSHLNAIERIARLLWFPTRKLIQFMPIESTEHADVPYRSALTNPKWPEKRLVDFMKRLTECVFPRARVTVESVEENSAASRFDVVIEPPQNSLDVKRYSFAVSVLFLPIGSAAGRAIFANVKR